MNTLRTVGRICGAALLGLIAASATAEELPSHFPPVETVGRHNLVLNGYGERARWFLNVYGCAIYAPRKTSSSKFLMSRSTPTAIRIRVNFTPPADPPDRWEATFREALPDDLYGEMIGVYEDLEAGDMIRFAYAPEIGTKAYLNGRLLFRDPGHGLMRGLLDQWLGPRPVSLNLRRNLLR